MKGTPNKNAPVSNNAPSDENILPWNKFETFGFNGKSDNVPCSRSGHTFTMIGSNGFLFSGCNHSKEKNMGPIDDMYQLKLTTKDGPYGWHRIGYTNGPKPRWGHTMTAVDTKLILFGGFYSSSNRFNDLWLFNSITMTWTQPVDESTIFTPRGNHVVVKSAWPDCPSPRGGHSACLYQENMLLVFGGYGGTGYSRRDFDDFYILDLKSYSWKKPMVKGVPPGKRSGHQAAVAKKEMFIFGGWNSTTQFGDVYVLDLDKMIWSNVPGFHMGSPQPRWGHACMAVKAIPDSKIFIFGGALGDKDNYTHQPVYKNDIHIFDAGTRKWQHPPVCGTLPKPRAETSLVYDSKRSRLLVFGGWSNCWYDDLYGLNVGCIVGPPYTVTSVHPVNGCISGGLPLTIEGIDFVNRPVLVRFSSKQGDAIEVPGKYINGQSVSVTSPNFSAYGPGEAEVRISFKGDSYTTTHTVFVFNAITSAANSYAFGPGILSGGAIRDQTMFVIQTRDSDSCPRSSGGDTFKIRIHNADGSEVVYLPSNIHDMEDGTYIVHFAAPKPTTYEINIEYASSIKPGPIIGSPFTVQFSKSATRDFNEMDGALVSDQVKNDLTYLNKTINECSTGLTNRVDDENWSEDEREAAIIAIKNHIHTVQAQSANIQFLIDRSQSVINFLRTINRPNDSLYKQITILLDKWANVLQLIPLMAMKTAPLIKAQQGKTRIAIKKYYQELVTYAEHVSRQEFWSDIISTSDASKALDTSFAEHHAEQERYNKFQNLATVFECFDLFEPCRHTMEKVEANLNHMRQLWDASQQVEDRLEVAYVLPWEMADGEVLETEALALKGLIEDLPIEIQFSKPYKTTIVKLDSFLESTAYIKLLQIPSIRSRHWEDLIGVTGCHFDNPIEFPEQKLTDLYESNVFNFSKHIEAIHQRAVKEGKQEIHLQELEERWETQELTMTPYTKDNIPIVSVSIETLELLESDHTTVAAIVNAGQTFFREQYEEWDITFALVTKHRIQFQKLSKLWKYLEPLLNGSNKEIAVALPDEMDLFRELSQSVSQLFNSLWEARTIFRAFAEMNNDTVQQIESQILSFESTKKSTNLYLNGKCNKFARLYLLSEQNLFEILSERNPRIVMLHISKLFFCIESVTIDEDDCTALTFDSRGSSTNQEKISFDTVVTLTGDAVDYFNVIQNAVEHTLKSSFKRSQQRYLVLQRVEWVLSKTRNGKPTDPQQILELVAATEFTKTVHNAFGLIEKGNSAAMVDVQKLLRCQLNDLVKRSTTVSGSDRRIVSNFVLYDLYMRDIVNELVSRGTTKKDNFVWRCVPKPIVKGNGVPCISLCNSDIDYGFEYMGINSRLIITPQTEKMFFAISQALQLQKAICVRGESCTGKADSIQSFARMYGIPFYMMSCESNIKFPNLVRILQGVFASGIWCFFRHIDLIPYSVLAPTTGILRLMYTYIKEDKDELLIGEHNIILNPRSAAFSTASFSQKKAGQVNQVLKETFCSFALVKPNVSQIGEYMLFASGTDSASAKILVSRLIGASQHIAESFQGSLSGCLLMKQVRECIGQFLVQKEHHAARSDYCNMKVSMELYFRPQISTAHFQKLAQILNLFFGDNFSGDYNSDEILSKDHKIFLSCTEDCQLWPDANFMAKLFELHDVTSRYKGVVICGPSGSGKSSLLRSYAAYNAKRGGNSTASISYIYPNALTYDALYGYYRLDSDEWVDGIIPQVLKSSQSKSKWIILDGRLLPNWVVPLRSLLGDSLLQLQSNERIASPKLITYYFETIDLLDCSPGMIAETFILNVSMVESNNYQCQCIVGQWILGRENDDKEIKAAIGNFMLDYIPKIVGELLSLGKSQISSVGCTNLLVCILDRLFLGKKLSLPLVRNYFVLAAIWSFGFSLCDEQRSIFSQWWKATFKDVSLPSDGTIFDYYYNEASNTFEHWSGQSGHETVISSNLESVTNLFIPLPQTKPVSYFATKLFECNYPVLLVGLTGVGKSQLAKSILTASSKSSDILYQHCQSEYGSQSAFKALKTKYTKHGESYWQPSKGKFLACYFDDIHIANDTLYASVRQYIDRNLWFDEDSSKCETLSDCRIFATANIPSIYRLPKRMLRHFANMRVGFPNSKSLASLFTRLITEHYSTFDESVIGYIESVGSAMAMFHASIVLQMKKTPINFHYEFHMHSIIKVAQGLFSASHNSVLEPTHLVTLWLHECHRVYIDCLSTEADKSKGKKQLYQSCKENFPAIESVSVYFQSKDPDPLLYSILGTEETEYDRNENLGALNDSIQTSIEEFNAKFPTDRLRIGTEYEVIEHIVRVLRIIRNPGGHLISCGEARSGKRSIVKLVAYLTGFHFLEFGVQHYMSTPSSYGILDFKKELRTAIELCLVDKLNGVICLLPQRMVCSQFGKFLSCLEELAFFGFMDSLFSNQDKQRIEDAFKSTYSDVISNDESPWEKFKSKVYRSFHVVLSISTPSILGNWAHQFPQLINKCTIDWWSPLSKSTIEKITTNYLESGTEYGVNEIEAQQLMSILPYMHNSSLAAASSTMNLVSAIYVSQSQYVEFLDEFLLLIQVKTKSFNAQIESYDLCLDRIVEAEQLMEDIDFELQQHLNFANGKQETQKILQVQVEEEKQAMEFEQKKVEAQTTKMHDAEAEATELDNAVQARIDDTEPISLEAKHAVQSISKRELGALKAMAKLPAGLDDVFSALLVLFAGINPKVQVKDDTGRVLMKHRTWDCAKVALLQNVTAFLDDLENYFTLIDEQSIPEQNIIDVRKYLTLKHFDSDQLEKKNRATAGLCIWIQAAVTFYDRMVLIEPFRVELKESKERLYQTANHLSELKLAYGHCKSRHEQLEVEYENISKEVTNALDQVDEGKTRKKLANRLLSTFDLNEQDRWVHQKEKIREQMSYVLGDAVVIAGMLTYASVFGPEERRSLITEKWMAHINEVREKSEDGGVASSESLEDAISLLGSKPRILDAERVRWQLAGLPGCTHSLTSAYISLYGKRWPMLLDPANYALSWLIKFAEESEQRITLHAMFSTSEALLDLERTVSEGGIFVLRDLVNDSELQNVFQYLRPLILRQVFCRDNVNFIRLGEKEVPMHDSFRFVMHTSTQRCNLSPVVQAEMNLVDFSLSNDAMKKKFLDIVVASEDAELCNITINLKRHLSELNLINVENEIAILRMLSDADDDIMTNEVTITKLESCKKEIREATDNIKQVMFALSKIVDYTISYSRVCEHAVCLFEAFTDLEAINLFYSMSPNLFTSTLIRGCRIAMEKHERATSKTPSTSVVDIVQIGRMDWNQLFPGPTIQAEALCTLFESFQAYEGVRMSNTLHDEKIKKRCNALKESLTEELYSLLSFGIFEKDRLLVSVFISITMLSFDKKLNSNSIQLLLGRNQSQTGEKAPVALQNWMPSNVWSRIRTLDAVEEYENIGDHISQHPEAWKSWYLSEFPDKLKPPFCPQNDPLARSILIGAFRPDRLTNALSNFVVSSMGKHFKPQSFYSLEASLSRSNASIPTVVVTDREAELQSKLTAMALNAKTMKEDLILSIVHIDSFQNVNGIRDTFCEASTKGDWIYINNVNIEEPFCAELCTWLGESSRKALNTFRCYIRLIATEISYDPANINLFRNAFKLVYDPPATLKARIQACWSKFSAETMSQCKKSTEYQGLLFCICIYHSVLCGRNQFRSVGFSQPYYFGNADILYASEKLRYYLDTAKILPWHELYLDIGLTVYGGSIRDAWDQRMSTSLLKHVMNEESLKGKHLQLNFETPDAYSFSYAKFSVYCDTKLRDESALYYGIQHGSGIEYYTQMSEKVVSNLSILGIGEKMVDSELAPNHKNLHSIVRSLHSKLPPLLELKPIQAAIDKHQDHPKCLYLYLLFEECTLLNTLLVEMRWTLSTIKKPSAFERMSIELFTHLQESFLSNTVPGHTTTSTSWHALSWPHHKNLSSWFEDVQYQVDFLNQWIKHISNFLPPVVLVSNLFRPKSLFRSVNHVFAKTQNLSIETITLRTNITSNVSIPLIQTPPESGIYIHGLYLEGATWHVPSKKDNLPPVTDGHLQDAISTVQYTKLPMVHIFGSKTPNQESSSIYNCPLYSTTTRSTTYITTINLPHRQKSNLKFILAGAALLLQPDHTT